jgi:replication factor A1
MVEQDQIAPHIEDISRVLGEKIDKTEIERMLLNYIEIYKISVDEAKRAIVKHFGGSPNGLRRAASDKKKLADLDGTEQNVDLLVRLVAVSPKQVTVKGKQRVIHTGVLADESGTRTFTAWTSDFPFEKGEVLSIRYAYARSWRERVEVQMGDRVRISREADDAVPPFKDLGGTFKVEDLRDGLTGVSLVGRIIEVEKREVEVSGLRKNVFSGLLADATGKVNFTSWHDFGLKEGDLIRVENGYVKSWRGIPQFTFDERGHVEKLPDEDFPSLKELQVARRAYIGDLAERGGAVGAEVQGVVIDIKSGSGLVFRCPECNRVVQKGACNLHGKVDGSPDLRIKAVIDDGTGALTAIIGRPLTEKLLGKGLEAAKAEASKAMTPDVIFDQLREKLLIENVKASGRVTSDDFGMMLLADAVEPVTPSVESEARSLLEQIEGEEVD